MKPHPTTNRQSCFKHQILSESNKNCKILQNGQKKGTHEVSGHFDTIWRNLNPPSAERELPAGDSVEDIKSSIRAYEWSQNTSKRLHAKFQVKPTPFDPPSTLERRNQASRRRKPPMPPLIKQNTWVASACFQRAARQISGHADNVWPGFDAPKQNQAYRRRSSPGPWHPNQS